MLSHSIAYDIMLCIYCELYRNITLYHAFHFMSWYVILNQIVLILYHIIISFDTIDTNYIAVSRCVHAISCRALRVPAGNPNDFKESSFIPGHLDIGHRLALVAPTQLSSISLGQNYLQFWPLSFPCTIVISVITLGCRTLGTNVPIPDVPC